MADRDPLGDIQAGFLAECEDLVERLVEALADPAIFAAGSEAIHRAFRAVHTIKGGAASLGHEALASDAHRFEERLDRLRSGNATETDCDPALLLAEADQLSARIAGLPGRKEPQQAADRPGDWSLGFRPMAALYGTGNEPLHLLSALRALGAAITCDQERLPQLEMMEPEGAYLGWSARLPAHLAEPDIRALFEFVEDLCDLSLERNLPQADPPPAPASGAGMPTLRVDLARIDRLLDLAGEIAIAQTTLSMAFRAAGTDRHGQPALALDACAALTRDLQDAVMAIRTQPVRPLFQRMARCLREAAGRAGKQARLVCEGEDTEIDRAIIEQLADPLTHMIRNAADHGLETPAARVRAGKSPTGEVRLRAASRAGRILIELSDDGAGIDRQKVREGAIRRGLVTRDQQLGEDETDTLIFAPGFTTSPGITALSGRGVGMDVVRTGIAGLGGRIAIASVPGAGTRFTLSLPLTLAVLDGLLVKAAGRVFVIPLASVVETALADPPDKRRDRVGLPLLRLQDRHVPLASLAALLSPAAMAAHDPVATPGPGIAVLIVDEDDRHLALGVDDILEQTQVVVKDLQRNCGPVPGISAATILGDGQVGLIVDPGTLVRMAARAPASCADPVR